MKTEQFENIKKHLYLAGKLHEIATFQCYYDGIAVFHIWMVNGVTELCFICDEMHFLDTEKVIDIIDREDLIPWIAVKITLWLSQICVLLGCAWVP